MDGSNAMMTDDLDRELAGALRVDPSPEFRARVGERVARERMKTGWMLPLPWAACAAAALVVTLGVAWQFAVRPLVGPQAPHDVAPAVAASTPASSVNEARGAPAPAAASLDRVAHPARRPREGVEVPAAAAAAPQEVVIAASEQAGVRLLFESVAAGRLELPEDMLQDLSLPIVEARGDLPDLDTPWTDRPEGDVR